MKNNKKLAAFNMNPIMDLHYRKISCGTQTYSYFCMYRKKKERNSVTDKGFIYNVKKVGFMLLMVDDRILVLE